MTFVCLSVPVNPAGEMSAVDLAPHLLAVTPRVRVGGGSNGEALIWADARGLAARPLAEALLALVRERGWAAPRAGVAGTPVAAEVAARFGRGVVVEVPPGGDRDFLAPYAIAVLESSDELRRMLEGTGIERCADLACLDQASVEVRFGAEGVALWRLARADDPRLLFEAIVRPLPHASLEWTDYVLRDPEQLLFVINRLAGSVCGALHELGQGARKFTLTFALASGATVEQPFHPSRPNANQRTWMRLARNELERIRLSDAVTGVSLSVDVAALSESVQGDVLDRGFGTAEAAEEAIARVLDQGSTVITPENSRHPVLRRRTHWIEQPPSLVWARPQIGPGDTEPELALHLLPEPEPIDVVTADHRGFEAPLRYRASEGWYELVSASGPDCVSGGQWETSYAYELYCCVRLDGEIVLLCHDARQNVWQLIGTWG